MLEHGNADDIFCTEDSLGNTVWISLHREALAKYCDFLRRSGETYRIVSRDTKVNNGRITLWLMTINRKR